MWYSTRRIVHNAGLLVTSTLLFIGITYIPLAAADNAKMDASEFRSSLDIKESDSSTKATVAENYGKLPLSFEVNNGQVDETVKFLSRGNGYTLYLTSDEAVLSLRRPSVTSDELLPTSKRYQVDRSKQAKIEVIRLKNIGVNSDTKIAGLEELPGKSNYFLGRDPKKWQTDVSNYAKVKIEDIYPGIDLIYYGTNGRLEYDWIVAPGADPSTIRFAVESKVDVKVDSQGNLILDERGELYLNKPLIYQERDHSRTEIAGEYVLLDRRHVGIQVGKYDAALPLIINPSLTYSTYLGGSSGESGYGIAADIFGNAYVTGATWSANFSTASPIQPSHGGGVEDAFVIKIGVGSDLLRRGVQKRIKDRMVR